MKVKENLDVFSGDFHYDLFLGGYLNPSTILSEESDIIKVEGAIKIINEYEVALRNNGLIEE